MTVRYGRTMRGLCRALALWQHGRGCLIALQEWRQLSKRTQNVLRQEARHKPMAHHICVVF